MRRAPKPGSRDRWQMTLRSRHMTALSWSRRQSPPSGRWSRGPRPFGEPAAGTGSLLLSLGRSKWPGTGGPHGQCRHRRSNSRGRETGHRGRIFVAREQQRSDAQQGSLACVNPRMLPPNDSDQRLEQVGLCLPESSKRLSRPGVLQGPETYWLLLAPRPSLSESEILELFGIGERDVGHVASQRRARGALAFTARTGASGESATAHRVQDSVPPAALEPGRPRHQPRGVAGGGRGRPAMLHALRHRLRERQRPKEKAGRCGRAGPGRALGQPGRRRDLHRALDLPLAVPKSQYDDEWALADSNCRPQPCEGCALTN
jgi:hypothetical protein